ncbi:MAG: hypothetical protein ACT4P7_09610 [Gemmatimonadaceae bacterium]
MRSLFRSSLLLPCLALTAAGCGADPSGSTAPAAARPDGGVLAIGGGDCPYPATTSGILAPINADNSSVFELRRTIPVKIRVLDCVTQQEINTLQPQIFLASIGPEGGEAVNELVSSSAADEGTVMRSAGNGQYLFNLSTKNSQFDAGRDLAPGTYQLTISAPEFADVVVQFALRR